MLLDFCLEKELCVSNTWYKWEEKRKVTFGIGVKETKIDSVLIKKEHRWFIQDVKAIPVEFQHAFVMADIFKRKTWKVVRKTCDERRKISLLKELKIRKRFQEKLVKLVDV